MSFDEGRTNGGRVPAKGLLARLARDSRGNTLAIVGAALVPLTAIIGSGIDMSRAYMAKTRMQSACDASALAARRVMQNDTLDNAVIQEARRYFDFNFRQGVYETAAFTPDVSRPTAGTVRVVASTTIPTTVMRLFGFTTLPLNVNCDASLNFVNTDVMLVLDVTGSMAWNVDGTLKNGVPLPDQRITALQDAVMALYDELEPTQQQLEANNLRLRYGMVPYSSAVNVGKLVADVNPNYIRNTSAYQSREGYFNTPVYPTTGTTTNGPYWEYYTGSTAPHTTLTATQATTGLSQANCLNFMNNVSFTGFSASPTTTGGPPPTATVVRSFPSDGQATSGSEWGWSGAPVNNFSSKSCRRLRTDTTTSYSSTARFAFTSWIYRNVTDFNTAELATGNRTTEIAINTAGTMPSAGYYNEQRMAAEGLGFNTAPIGWAGCIEERDTVSTITASSGYNVPSGATDLNIDLVPNSEATRWKPHWPRMVYRRTAGNTSSTGSGVTAMQPNTSESTYACPVEAKRLQAWTRTAIQNYVNGLQPIGGTYHDIGMIWGARMISRAGIFADSPDTYNGMPVSRHIIFMTDGEMAPNCNTYTSYGIEQNDYRITGASSCPQQTDRHMQRFRMICNATKSMNVSIWVIAFGSTLEQHLIDCASNANQASRIDNRDDLIARFRQIGSQIGALRLTQ